MKKETLRRDLLDDMNEAQKPNEGAFIDIKITPETNLDSYLNNSVFNFEIHEQLTEPGYWQGIFPPLEFFNLLYEKYHLVKMNKERPTILINHLLNIELEPRQFFFLLYCLKKLIEKQNGGWGLLEFYKLKKLFIDRGIGRRIKHRRRSTLRRASINDNQLYSCELFIEKEYKKLKRKLISDHETITIIPKQLLSVIKKTVRRKDPHEKDFRTFTWYGTGKQRKELYQAVVQDKLIAEIDYTFFRIIFDNEFIQKIAKKIQWIDKVPQKDNSNKQTLFKFLFSLSAAGLISKNDVSSKKGHDNLYNKIGNCFVDQKHGTQFKNLSASNTHCPFLDKELDQYLSLKDYLKKNRISPAV